jgi:hypothetical protein
MRSAALLALLVTGCNSVDQRVVVPPPEPVVAELMLPREPKRYDYSPQSYLEEFRPARRLLRVIAGGFFVGSDEFWLADAQFLIVHRSDSHQERRLLSPEVAAEAWGRIDALHIADWRRSYTPKDIYPNMTIFDGEQWWVSLRVDSAEHESAGDNTYPSRLPLGSPTLRIEESKVVPTAFHDLLEVMRDVRKASEPNQALEPTRGAVTPHAP